MNKLCECGCGREVINKGNRFIRGHNSCWVSKFVPKPEPKLCACGCGNYAKSGKDYIYGHNRIGKIASVETINKRICSLLEYYSKNGVSDSARLAMSEAKSGISLSPEHILAITEGGRENSEMMRGGNDLVDHHIIYDDADLSKHTIPMTRSDHTRLHRLFQKYGIIVPHININ